MGFFVKVSHMKNQHQFNKLAAKPLFNAKEARNAGIHPSRLAYYAKIELIERLGRGIYRGIDSQINVDFQWEDLVMTVKSVPSGIVCLTSALSLYKLTEEIPRQHWIAIPHATTAPKREQTKFIRMRNTTTGKIALKIGKESIAIFNIERTIIDAFRYLGKEIAIKALKEALKSNRKQKLNIRKLKRYAKKFRVNIEPYLMAIKV